MKITIYRKRYIPGGGYMIDEQPENVFNDVSACMVGDKYIDGYIGLTEPIRIQFDHINYNYVIS